MTYEYKLTPVPTNCHPVYQEEFAQLGLEGWECVGLGNHVVVWKRALAPLGRPDRRLA